jgi:DNA mismatch endonuclease, patch repair protein
VVDKISPEVRSWVMSRIKGKNTKPEITIRKLLHSLGFRFRLHVENLPGMPDIVLPKYKAVVMINGCFWHGHNCSVSNRPKTRPEFWSNKIEKNKDRDNRNRADLLNLGWRVITIWECAIFGKCKISQDEISLLISDCLRKNLHETVFEIKGRNIE